MSKLQLSLGRRSLLRWGAASSAGLLPALSPRSAAAAPEVRRYVRLGRTELKISDISFGASRLRQGEEHLVEHAIARGINYFDSAESYTRGDSERVLGNAIRGKRDRVYIVSKTHAGASTSKAQLQANL